MGSLLSICIPVYNFVVVDMVSTFQKEADRANLEIEIIIFDDHSLPFFVEQNATLCADPRVKFLPLVENLGRGRIRNRLADFARGDWLLFMDCDVAPIFDDYLQRYFRSFEIGADLLCGGMYYKRPTRREYQLRWRYERSIHRFRKRQARRSPALGVVTGNFAVRRELFRRLAFNEDLTGYGQEDRLFALNLEEIGARVLYIENPMEHLGYERNDTFVRKIEESIVNVARTWNAFPQHRQMMLRTSGRLRALDLCKKLGLGRVLRIVARLFRRPLYSHLVGLRARLWNLELYQFAYLTYVMSRPNLATIGGSVDNSTTV